MNLSAEFSHSKYLHRRGNIRRKVSINKETKKLLSIFNYYEVFTKNNCLFQVYWYLFF